MRKPACEHNGYRIIPSGKMFFKILDSEGYQYGTRVTTIEAARAVIDSKGRVMTPAEHALVYSQCR